MIKGDYYFPLVLVLATLPVIGGASPAGVDIVLTHAHVYTMNPAAPWADAVAIDAGRIAFVGPTPAAQRFIGKRTKVIDLHGQFVMPGLVDAHVHPVIGGLKVLYECNFPFTATPQQVSSRIRDCASAAPKGAWIRGGQWSSGYFETHALASPKAFLDSVAAENPVMLVDDSEHNAWVNSAALRAAGIDASTPDPAGGRIGRASNGEPNGLLFESAFRVLLKAVLPPWTAEQHEAAVRAATRLANSYGITALKDAGAYEEYLAAYQAVDEAGDLHMHVAACLRTPSGVRSVPLDYADLEARRDRFRSAHLHTGFVKIFLDGVPTSARTAAMLSPYVPDSEHGQSYAGAMLVDSHVLAQDLIELDRRGFTVKMHGAGDAAVRVALDAIEAARVANGVSGQHHEIAHAGYIDAQDLPRFAKLDAIPDFSPMIWYPSPIIASITRALGPRGEHYWPTRTLLETGALVAGGSDWPAAVADENPWTGIQALVTRADPQGETPGVLWKEQAVSLAQALRIYTINGARALRLDAVTGSIGAGKSADLIVLDRDLFAIPATEIARTQVRMTFFEGRQVYGASQ